MPAASVFLAQDAMLGGDIGRSVQEFMSAHDHQPTSPTDPPDHLAEEVRFLEYLLAADHREAASNFFTHLGGWAPLCLSVISTSGSVLFESVAEALKDALFEFGHNLPQSAGLDLFHPSLTPGPVTFQLEHSRTGLAQIGSFFPPRLSAASISRKAESVGWPAKPIFRPALDRGHVPSKASSVQPDSAEGWTRCAAFWKRKLRLPNWSGSPGKTRRYRGPVTGPPSGRHDWIQPVPS